MKSTEQPNKLKSKYTKTYSFQWIFGNLRIYFIIIPSSPSHLKQEPDNETFSYRKL